MSDTPEFFTRLARLLNSGQSRSVLLGGAIHDLFWDGERHTPLVPFLLKKTKTNGLLPLVYELNGPIRIADADRDRLRGAWVEWKSGVDPALLGLEDLRKKSSQLEFHQQEFDRHLTSAIGSPTAALELLRQLTICSRTALREHLLIIVEAADMLLPETGDLSRLNDAQLRRISIVEDWFSDPDFVAGDDSVVLLAESRSMVHSRVARMPQVLSVEAPAPTLGERVRFIDEFIKTAERKPRLWSTQEALGECTAGLSLHALRQMLAGAAYSGDPLTPAAVFGKVEEFIQTRLGDDVVEFKKPSHRMTDVIGFTQLKKFLTEELMPRFKAAADTALPGAAVAGAIGGGKTFIFEAVAAELDLPVLVLKNIRSQWFGQTDVIFERLRAVLEALGKVVIFVDEADTQFGRVDANAHETERRLTGKIQQMMSDPKLRGEVLWLLMTARIHLLSPDIRRPGRVGDLIIPVLDPTGDDRVAFINWVVDAIKLDEAQLEKEGLTRLDLVQRMNDELLPPEYSAASFASLRSYLKATQPKTWAEVMTAVHDQLPPAIGPTREYQTLQALVNCTRRSLLPNPDSALEDRVEWERRIRELELEGIS
ncbi:AAA family ATPase [Botrimarina mediterranea]|uniref:ATPase family associated with various cellular activities (AAA) n=1 Tax=Botrimarina mediterranea TaxID=2528022 RepID=A0A518KCZ7_9BACT|nr:AAA family ATPase [Botrimarina mediterranea]QDV75662.1 ATPase family associated with various cellular activities (AAA) [Botrimarina mediterranea]QDV80298.1 ATPase family associated with various cellular activities (AAA) [Planctomycetes bacterium K2D]